MSEPNDTCRQHLSPEALAGVDVLPEVDLVERAELAGEDAVAALAALGGEALAGCGQRLALAVAYEQAHDAVLSEV